MTQRCPSNDACLQARLQKERELEQERMATELELVRTEVAARAAAERGNEDVELRKLRAKVWRLSTSATPASRIPLWCMYRIVPYSKLLYPCIANDRISHTLLLLMCGRRKRIASGYSKLSAASSNMLRQLHDPVPPILAIYYTSWLGSSCSLPGISPSGQCSVERTVNKISPLP